MNHQMIFVLVLLLLVNSFGHACGCSWKDHCAGDPCASYNDCDGSLICINGKCGSNGNSGQSEPCSWKGHCVGDPCATHNDCDGSLVCVSGTCGSTGSTGSNGNGDQSGTCSSSGVLHGTTTACNTDNFSSCCKTGESYPQYTCSPSSKSLAILTLNSFQEGGDGGWGGACYGKFYSDSVPVVALSTGWYNGGSRCGKNITIYANGKSTKAMVVDECDSVHGCDDEHAGQPPCRNNIVDGSPAVWAALGISKNDPKYGLISISWSD